VWIPAAASCCCWSCCCLHHPAAAAITLTSWEWKRRSRRSSCRKQRGRPLLHRHPRFPHPPKAPSQTDGRSELIYKIWGLYWNMIILACVETWEISYNRVIIYHEIIRFLLKDFLKIYYIFAWWNKYLSFHKFFFCLKILFKCKWQGHQSVTHPLLVYVKFWSSILTLKLPIINYSWTNYEVGIGLLFYFFWSDSKIVQSDNVVIMFCRWQLHELCFILNVALIYSSLKLVNVSYDDNVGKLWYGIMVPFCPHIYS
jgi:hypothetical protein